MSGCASRLLAGSSAVYIVASPTARTDASWPARGYAGPSGRLDVLARAAISALTLEPGALFAGILLGPPRPPKLLLAGGGCLAGAGGERGVMGVFRRLLLGREVEGCCLLDWEPGRLLLEARRLGFSLYILDESGVDISRAPGALAGPAAFLAGAHLDPPAEVLAAAGRLARARVSVGPKSLLTSHVFAFIAALRRSRLCLRASGGSC